MTPGAYLGVIASNMLGRLWWLFAIPAVCFVIGLADWRWAAVGLIVLFLIYPIIVTTALMTDGMRPEVIRRASATSAEINGDRINIYRGEQHELIESAQIVDIISGKTYTRYIIGKRSYDFILIPNSVLS